jgi:hypothetical protein
VAAKPNAEGPLMAQSGHSRNERLWNERVKR